MDVQQDVFSAWVASRPAGLKPLGERSEMLYRQRWAAFEKWLAENGKDARSASPADLEAFLFSRVRRAANAVQPSVLTTSRYLAGLQHVYRFGMLTGYFQTDTAAEVVLPQAAIPDGMVLPLPWLLAVADDIDQAPESFTALRNALLVQLCAVEAFSVADLTGLILRDAQVMVPVGSKLVDVHLQLRGKRAAQRRTRILDGESAALMYKWIQVLPTLPGYPLSESLLRSHPTKPSLTPKCVYEVCAGQVRKTLTRLRVPVMPYHLGPNVLRNSCIVAWLNGGANMEAVCAKIGVSGPRQLARLAHAFHAI